MAQVMMAQIMMAQSIGRLVLYFICVAGWFLMPGSLTWEDLDGKLVGQGGWDGLCVIGDMMVFYFYHKVWTNQAWWILK